MADALPPSPRHTGRLLPFASEAPRRAPSERDVLAICYAFADYAKARAERIAATPVTLKPKRDRRQP
jgi:hypothetical protein